MKSLIYQLQNDVVLCRGGIQRAGYTARKFLYVAHHNKLNSCNSNAWQSEWGFTLEFVEKVLRPANSNELHSTAKCFFRRK